MQADSTGLLRKFYFASFFISLLASVLVFVFYSTEKPTYKATGKFTYFYETGAIPSQNPPFTSDVITKSIAESLSSRSLVDALYASAQLKVPQSYKDNPSRAIRARVLTGSSVIAVELYSRDADALNKLGQVFFSVLDRSSVMTNRTPKPIISIIDPFYTETKSTYPKPFEYAAITFIGSLLVSLMFLYIFSSNE